MEVDEQVGRGGWGHGQLDPGRFPCVVNSLLLKGTVQRDFRPPVFLYYNSNLTGPLANGLKYFRFV